MPTTLPRTNITHTPRIQRALDVASRRWPNEPDGKLLVRLVTLGAEAIAPEAGDPVTEALDIIADELAREVTANPGRALVESGSWEW
jgi:hypothetical protein